MYSAAACTFHEACMRLCRNTCLIRLNIKGILLQALKENPGPSCAPRFYESRDTIEHRDIASESEILIYHSHLTKLCNFEKNSLKPIKAKRPCNRQLGPGLSLSARSKLNLCLDGSSMCSDKASCMPHGVCLA